MTLMALMILMTLTILMALMMTRMTFMTLMTTLTLTTTHGAPRDFHDHYSCFITLITRAPSIKLTKPCCQQVALVSLFSTAASLPLLFLCQKLFRFSDQQY